MLLCLYNAITSVMLKFRNGRKRELIHALKLGFNVLSLAQVVYKAQVYCDREKNRGTILSSLQAVIIHSSDE